jgi:hypothetical protein
MVGEGLDRDGSTDGVLEALEYASAAREGGWLGSCGILEAIIATDKGSTWDTVQLKTTFLSAEEAAARDLEESPSPHVWRGVRLTRQAAQAVIDTERIARTYRLTPIPAAVLALGMLARPQAGAAQAMLVGDAHTHDELLALVQDHVLGSRLEHLSRTLDATHTTPATSSTTSTQQARNARLKRGPVPSARPHDVVQTGPEQPKSRRAAPIAGSKATLGFRLGTFVAAFLLAGVAGLQPALALFLALMIQQGAARAGRHHRLRTLVPPAAAMGLIAAISLAATANSDFSNDVAALNHLHVARHAIGAGDFPLATKELGAATLYENESVTLNTLSACVDWALGFKDYATLEAQLAVNAGYKIGEPSGFQGRGCFLDVLPFSGIGAMHLTPLVTLLYPLPNTTDAAGDRFLSTAGEQRVRDSPLAMVALACLANRYDFKMTAGYLFTLGLGVNAALHDGPLPSAAVQRCLNSKVVQQSYSFYADPVTGTDVYEPRDMVSRIPSPAKPHPPGAVCWARFPDPKLCPTGE